MNNVPSEDLKNREVDDLVVKNEYCAYIDYITCMIKGKDPQPWMVSRLIERIAKKCDSLTYYNNLRNIIRYLFEIKWEKDTQV